MATAIPMRLNQDPRRGGGGLDMPDYPTQSVTTPAPPGATLFRGRFAMRKLLGVVVVLLLQGCASAPPARAPDNAYFRDELFAPAGERIDANDVFAMTPEMRRYL